MMEFERLHTKGPWQATADHTGHHIYHSRGHGKEHVLSTNNAKASDVSLAKTAPEMVDVLIWIARTIDGLPDNHPGKRFEGIFTKQIIQTLYNAGISAFKSDEWIEPKGPVI